MKPEQYSNLAKELHKAEKRRELIEPFSKRFPDMTFDDSYATQSEWISLKLSERTDNLLRLHRVCCMPKAQQNS